VVDHGRIIASGTADQLKAEVGGERVEVVVHDPAQLAAAREVIGGECGGEVSVQEQYAGSPRPRRAVPASSCS
jgi:ABC-2 type transport system ATP-binding protein